MRWIIKCNIAVINLSLFSNPINLCVCVRIHVYTSVHFIPFCVKILLSRDDHHRAILHTEVKVIPIDSTSSEKNAIVDVMTTHLR